MGEMKNVKFELFSKEGCPRCDVLEKKIEKLGLPVIKNTDVDEMLAMGINDIPVLKVELMLDFKDANDFLNNYILPKEE